MRARVAAGGAGRDVPLDNYHVTLKFLGALEPDGVARAQAAVTDLAAAPTCAQALAVTGFPRPAAARLAAAELHPLADLEAWWAALEARLGSEGRGFRPHVTVLRFRRPRPLAPQVLPEPVELDLKAPRLYRSDPVPGGVRYRPVDEPSADSSR